MSDNDRLLNLIELYIRNTGKPVDMEIYWFLSNIVRETARPESEGKRKCLGYIYGASIWAEANEPMAPESFEDSARLIKRDMGEINNFVRMLDHV